jgi:hypothetical protein
MFLSVGRSVGRSVPVWWVVSATLAHRDDRFAREREGGGRERERETLMNKIRISRDRDFLRSNISSLEDI